MTELKYQEHCYLSTPKHVRSFVGIFLYIYTGKGSLTLTRDELIFERPREEIVIPLAAIQDVRLGRYSLIAKPVPLKYIAVTFDDEEAGEETLLFTPTKSWATPVWTTNKIVAEWEEELMMLLERDHGW